MGSPLTLDLTRQDGGDVLGARLPAEVALRPAAALGLVDRAVTRWALQSCRSTIAAAMLMMIQDQTDVEPLDVCVRITPTLLTIMVGTHMVPVSLMAGGCTARAA